MEQKTYAFFWGCQIPARLPFIEKSTRMVLNHLGVAYVDLPGFTCCPEKSLIKNFKEFEWLLVASRNLALAEKEGLDVITACNGCYSTLKEAAAELNNSSELKKKVNERLSALGLTYQGRVQVLHLVEFLHDKVGLSKIRASLRKPLNGLKIAVHNGCHLLRPSSAIRFDDPLKPGKYDALVEALGASSLAYETKMLCCGNGLGNVGEAEESLALTRKKLLEVQAAGADALTVVCPACFMQYDQKQYLAQRQGEHLHVPVFTYPELLGLAMGLDPQELGLDGHRVDTAGFFRVWENYLGAYELVRRHLDLQAVRKCYECGACVVDCPVAESSNTFNPNRLIGEVLAGKIEELISSPEIWKCLECHTCYELCPQKFGMEKVFSTLKHLAMERNILPPPLKGGVDMFMKTGRLGNPDERARKKYGLGPAATTGREDLRKLLGA
ncbi:MAG: heterodisulfide reductase subunit [Clostridia bacterium]|nr:heterodisulfide reductase subunit [Clostridia bacterium]